MYEKGDFPIKTNQEIFDYFRGVATFFEAYVLGFGTKILSKQFTGKIYSLLYDQAQLAISKKVDTKFMLFQGTN